MAGLLHRSRRTPNCRILDGLSHERAPVCKEGYLLHRVRCYRLPSPILLFYINALKMRINKEC